MDCNVARQAASVELFSQQAEQMDDKVLVVCAAIDDRITNAVIPDSTHGRGLFVWPDESSARSS